MLESEFQKDFVIRLQSQYPGAVVFKTDPNILSFPDLMMLHGSRWAAFEMKKEKDADQQPNQEWWVNRLNRMSFASFLYPENEEEVLRELAHTL